MWGERTGEIEREGERAAAASVQLIVFRLLSRSTLWLLLLQLMPPGVNRLPLLYPIVLLSYHSQLTNYCLPMSAQIFIAVAAEEEKQKMLMFVSGGG